MNEVESMKKYVVGWMDKNFATPEENEKAVDALIAAVRKEAMKDVDSVLCERVMATATPLASDHPEYTVEKLNAAHQEAMICRQAVRALGREG